MRILKTVLAAVFLFALSSAVPADLSAKTRGSKSDSKAETKTKPAKKSPKSSKSGLGEIGIFVQPAGQMTDLTSAGAEVGIGGGSTANLKFGTGFYKLGDYNLATFGLGGGWRMYLNGKAFDGLYVGAHGLLSTGGVGYLAGTSAAGASGLVFTVGAEFGYQATLMENLLINVGLSLDGGFGNVSMGGSGVSSSENLLLVGTNPILAIGYKF